MVYGVRRLGYIVIVLSPEGPKILPLWNQALKDHSNHVFFLGGGNNSIIVVFMDPLGRDFEYHAAQPRCKGDSSRRT